MTILYQWRHQISLHIQSLFATCKLDFILTPSQSDGCTLLLEHLFKTPQKHTFHVFISLICYMVRSSE